MAYQRPSGGVVAPSLEAIFNEGPRELTSPPSAVTGPVRAAGELVQPTPTFQFGWLGGAHHQTAGMSTLNVDQVVQVPNPEVQGAVATAIHRSAEAPGPHMRNAFWLYRDWDPIYRFANTFLDVRWAAGHVQPLSNAEPGNLPGQGARMGAQPVQMQAWRVPRFQTTPYTIVPTPQGGVPQ